MRASDSEAAQVAERWEQFVQHLGLGLSQRLGQGVKVVTPRGQTTAQRVVLLTKSLAESGCLRATFRVPGAIGDLQLAADLRAKQTLTSVTFDAPTEMRAKPRINWLLRQLTDAPPTLRVEVHYSNARDTTGLLLQAARENLDGLLYRPDPRREPKAFTITLARAMGQKRGKAEGSFVAETSIQAFDFYGDLVQNLKPWAARAPRLREDAPPAALAEPDAPVPREDISPATPDDASDSAAGGGSVPPGFPRA